MRDLLNESLTQVSFDDVFSSFLDALSDMDSSSEEFANNFEKYMQKAILNSMLIDNYKSRINEWYKALLKPMNQAVLMKRNMQICKKAGMALFPMLWKSAML